MAETLYFEDLNPGQTYRTGTRTLDASLIKAFAREYDPQPFHTDEIKDEKHKTVEDQYLAAKETTFYIADMIEAGWEVAIGHGNSPQVGLILRRSEIAAKVEGMHEIPLDVCGADSQGAIGYALQQTLQNELYQRGIKKNVATIVTQTLVDRDDPAFKNPTKPIGGFMDEQEAHKRAQELSWDVVEDAGRGWRRVVASPLPKEVVELESVKKLIDSGVVVITVGGAGIPVIEDRLSRFTSTASFGRAKCCRCPCHMTTALSTVPTQRVLRGGFVNASSIR